MNKKTLAALCASFSMTWFSSGSMAMAVHSGDNDPLTEGWTLIDAAASNTVVRSAVNDGGVLAWSVDDNSTASGSIAFYNFDVSETNRNDASTAGWVLTTTLRNVDTADSPRGSPFIAYRDGAVSWQLQFGSDADGDAIVLARDSLPDDLSGSSYTLEGSGSVYNTYTMIFDPLAGNADIFVNGVERISDYGGFAFSDNTGVFFGAGRSPDTGQGNFSAVSWSVVPVPAAFWLLGPVIVGVLSRRRKLG